RDEESSLAGRVTELELALSAARADAEGLRRALETEHARAIALSGEIHDERNRVAAERALRERLELDATSRDDDAIRLRARIDELEQGLAERHTDAEGLRAIVAELEQSLAVESATRAEAAELRRQLEATRAEFDEKLQTIVTHLAADHEADLGKAVEEREEARAEARSAKMKIAAMQQKLDEMQEPRKRRVLIVYPDATLRMNARAILERAGYEVVGAADGLEALRTAIAARPDVVIADAVMPKMDGRELCQLLKSQEKTAHIRVILLTRATDDPPRGDFPPDQVLRKPVPLETLKATLAALTA
ncbi:MAG TPA: response regulator, partial [Thermoanaerobaculia bacterium]|nr:response regulator [Thermoanaerobaculia bacterium]